MATQSLYIEGCNTW